MVAAFIDTNVVLRNSISADPLHEVVSVTLQRLVSQDVELCISAQVIFEFWVVATRPQEVNGLGMSPQAAREKLAEVRRAYTQLPESSDPIDRWLELCTTYNVSGREAHDARIVAAMQESGIDKLVTLNPVDFRRYREIIVIDPRSEA